MADIFISYKSDRRAAAEHLAEILADYGWTVWWDYELASGRDFGAQIERELRAAGAVVVLWCGLSRESEWVKEEAALAKRLGTLVPARIEAVELPLGFSLAQTVDLADWDGSPSGGSLRRLLVEIERVIGRKARPNFEGLARTERSWRRYGALPLRDFPLTRPVEPDRPSPAPAPAGPSTRPQDLGGESRASADWVGLAIAILVLLALGTLAYLLYRPASQPAQQPVEADTLEQNGLVAPSAPEADPSAEEQKAAYDEALAARTSARYRRFLADHPQSGFAGDVRRRLASCTSATVRVRPGREVNSEFSHLQGDDVSFREQEQQCRAALERQCPSGIVEHSAREQWGLSIPLQAEPDGSHRQIITCYATCFRTRSVETCD